MRQMPYDANGRPLSFFDYRTTQTVNVSTTSAASSAFTKRTVVEIYCATDCFIEIGANPTATASSLFLPGGGTRTVVVEADDKIAGILELGTDKMRLTY